MRLVGKKIAAERGGKVLFTGLDFSLCSGHSLVVSGPNGVGKSTLLRIIAGLYEPLEGSVFVESETTLPLATPLFFHYLSEKNAMKANLSVRENLYFWNNWLGGTSQNIDSILDSVGMLHSLDMPFGTLSTGQRRTIALARLLVVERPLWILDEPMSNIDKTASDLFFSLMKRHLCKGGMIIAATHIPLKIPFRNDVILSGSLI